MSFWICKLCGHGTGMVGSTWMACACGNTMRDTSDKVVASQDAVKSWQEAKIAMQNELNNGKVKVVYLPCSNFMPNLPCSNFVPKTIGQFAHDWTYQWVSSVAADVLKPVRKINKLRT